MLTKILILFVLVLLVAGGAFFVLNPTEKSKEGRDKQRISDLKRLKEALDSYITKNAKVGSPLCRDCQIGKDVFAYRDISISEGTLKIISKRYVNSHGWVPVDLSKNAELFSTIPLLPIDPLEETYSVRQSLPFVSSFFPAEKEDFVYTYTPGENGKYKLTAKMESKTGLSEANSDGGSLVDRYEVGDLKLFP